MEGPHLVFLPPPSFFPPWQPMLFMLLEIDVIHVVFLSIRCIRIYVYAYDYMHMSPVLDCHLTFSLTALRNITDGTHII